MDRVRCLGPASGTPWVDINGLSAKPVTSVVLASAAAASSSDLLFFSSRFLLIDFSFSSCVRDAWSSLGEMSKESAMAAYVHEMKKVAQEVFFYQTSLANVGRLDGFTVSHWSS